MNNPFVELPDVRFKKCLILFAKRNEIIKKKIMSLCLKQARVGSGYYKSRLITTKQNQPSFVSFLVFGGCRERTAHFDARPKTVHS